MPMALFHRQLIAVVAALAVQACANNASLRDAPFEISEDYANNVIRYTVQRGDRLGDIALEFTGNLDTWRPIAEHNGITDPKALSVGSQIEIPTALIPGYDEKRLSRRRLLTESRPIEENLAQTNRSLSEETPGVPTSKVSEAVSDTRQGDISSTSGSTDQIDTTDVPLVNSVAEAEPGVEVRVVGTYYPKGVYEEPTMNSRLMMRVAPGSDFALVEQLNGWYRIETESGPGFLRSRDGRILGAEPQAGKF